MRKLSWKLAGGLGLGLATLVLAVAPVVQAAEFIAPDRQANDGNVTVSSGESHRNLYLGGGTVTVNAPTTGDLFAAGGTVIVNGDVEQDLNIGGGTVVVNNKVGGDVRAGGGSVNLNAPIGGDLLVAGGNVVLGEKASVGGDLVISGGTVTINGPVSGSAKIMGRTVTINSALAGSVKVRANQKLTFGPNARVSQAVDYRGPEPAVMQQGSQVSQVNFTEEHNRRGARRAVASIFTAVFLFKLIAYIIAALLVMRFLKRPAYAVVNRIHASPWANLGIGFLGVIVTPLVAIIVAITVVGFYVGVIIGLVFVLSLVMAVIFGAMYLGALVIKWLMKKPDLVLDWQAVLIGTVLLAVVGFIPVVGPLFCAVIILMAFGAGLRLKWQWLKQQGGMSTTI